MNFETEGGSLFFKAFVQQVKDYANEIEVLKQRLKTQQDSNKILVNLNSEINYYFETYSNYQYGGPNGVKCFEFCRVCNLFDKLDETNMTWIRCKGNNCRVKNCQYCQDKQNYTHCEKCQSPFCQECIKYEMSDEFPNVCLQCCIE